jgi:hypothetical protein
LINRLFVQGQAIQSQKHHWRQTPAKMVAHETPAEECLPADHRKNEAVGKKFSLLMQINVIYNYRTKLVESNIFRCYHANGNHS